MALLFLYKKRESSPCRVLQKNELTLLLDLRVESSTLRSRLPIVRHPLITRVRILWDIGNCVVGEIGKNRGGNGWVP